SGYRMNAFVATLVLCVGQAERGPAPGIDLSPVKAPLDRVAGAVEKALGQIDKARNDVFRGLNWAAVGGAVLLTVLVMQTLHLHGLAASKANLNLAEKRS